MCLGLLGKGHRLYPTPTERGNGCIKVLLPAALWVRDSITIWVGPSTLSSLIFQIPPVPNSESAALTFSPSRRPLRDLLHHEHPPPRPPDSSLQLRWAPPTSAWLWQVGEPLPWPLLAGLACTAPLAGAVPGSLSRTFLMARVNLSGEGRGRGVGRVLIGGMYTCPGAPELQAKESLVRGALAGVTAEQTDRGEGLRGIAPGWTWTKPARTSAGREWKAGDREPALPFDPQGLSIWTLGFPDSSLSCGGGGSGMGLGTPW